MANSLASYCGPTLSLTPVGGLTERQNARKIYCIRTNDHEELWIIADGRIERKKLINTEPSTTLDLFTQNPDTGEKKGKAYAVRALTQAKSGHIVAVCEIPSDASDSDSDSNGSQSDVTDTRKWLIEIKPSGEIIKDIVARGCYGDVCSQDDVIFGITESSDKNGGHIKITQHTKTQESWGNVPGRPPPPLPLKMNGILASLTHLHFVQTTEHSIHKLNRNNSTATRKYGSKIDSVPQEAGHLNYPSLCLTDEDGSILVADFKNDRFQVLLSTNEWKILQFDPKGSWPAVRRPRDATMSSNGDLYILYDGWNIYKVEKP